MTVPAEQKPPLSVWVVAVLVASAILLALCNLHRMAWISPPGEKLRDFNLQRLQALPPDALHVVVLGSSKTVYAIDFDQAFAARLALRGRVVVFNRVTTLNPQPLDFQQVLAAIVRRPPDVLLVETELLVLNRDTDAPAAALDHARQNLLLAWARLAGTHADYALNNNRGLEDWPLASSCSQSKSPGVLHLYADSAAHWRTTTAGERAPFLAYLRHMQAAGVRVVLLGVPRSPAASAIVPAGIKRQAVQLRDQLVKENGFLAWSPSAMEDALYCDQMHVNRSGRAFYSAWLAKQLTVLLEHPHG